MRRCPAPLSVVLVLTLLLVSVPLAGAVAPANEHIQRTWARTDQPVLSGAVARTWIWGPEANTGALEEDYFDAPGGKRLVQYFDKSRMEINNPQGDPASPFYVTNGLLVIELMTGRLQLGHDTFEPHKPSLANVAGDQGDPDSPTYAALAPLRNAPALPDGTVITQRLSATGQVSNDPSLAAQNVTAAYRLTVPGIDHQVASPFWDFLNSSGPVVVNGQAVNQRLFDPWFYATGYPVTEAYWADVRVAGTTRLVLLQCFERRCLTYTPGNPAGFLTEAGNVGQHYHHWRYVEVPGEGQTPPPPPVEPTHIYGYAGEWGGRFAALAPLKGPAGVAIDANDNLWVADPSTDRMVMFNGNGVFVAEIGAQSPGLGELKSPYDAAFGPNGRIYLVDSGNHRIQIIGDALATWGSLGAGAGQFFAPSAIEVHGDVVYVLDTYNHRVQMFDLDGVYLGQFGEKGTGDGQLDSPLGMAIDAQGNVLVTDEGNSRVQKFTAQGEFVSKFGSFGSGDGQLSIPWGIDVGESGAIYVADSANHRVQMFSAGGQYITQWGAMGSGPGEFMYPAGLSVDSEGNVYVSDEGNGRVQKFSSDGGLLFQVSDSRRGRFGNPRDITAHGHTLLVVDTYGDSPLIATYSSDGVPLYDRELSATPPGLVDLPVAVAVSALDEHYVLDSATARILRYSSTWDFIGEWGGQGNGPGQFATPSDIAIDIDGNIYVADSGNGRVQKFDFSGAFVRQWGGVGDGQVTFSSMQGLAVHGDRVYVTDYGNHRIQVFDRDGTYIGQWGSVGGGLGQLRNPMGIAVNQYGYVLVVENGNNRVQVFSPVGNPVSVFGVAGAGPGQFVSPTKIAVDASGNVFVADNGNYRVQKLVMQP